MCVIAELLQDNNRQKESKKCVSMMASSNSKCGNVSGLKYNMTV